jgi:NADH-quinone oxidoreductase subunit L
MFRLYLLTFRGEPRLTPEAEHHLHESPPSMVVPLAILAVLSAVGGLIGPPLQEGGHLFARWLAPVFEGAHAAGEAAAHGAGHAGGHAVSPATEWMLIVISIGVAVLGLVLAFRVYGKSATEPLARRAPGLYGALVHKYWVDELYDLVVVRVVYGLSRRLWTFWDEKIVDGAVNGVARLLEGTSTLMRLFQTGFVGTYALFFTIGVALLLLHFLRQG